MTELFIGLMSGTSLDGVDGVLVDFSLPKLKVLSHVHHPMPNDLKTQFLSLNRSGPDELHQAAVASQALVRIEEQIVIDLLKSANVNRSQVRAIGSHGQTVRHQPPIHNALGYSLQLNQPAFLAELTGIDVVADFRSRDIAAGGQGAPLVPAFHAHVFSQPQQTISTLNIGGFANICVIGPQASSDVIGFDCGPGNVLIDTWCQQKLKKDFDASGDWARSGKLIPALMDQLLNEPYFSQALPKSTGRDLFNQLWLANHLRSWSNSKAEDIQATLTELTAVTISIDLIKYGKDSKRLLLCGGGALNVYLIERIQVHLPFLKLSSTTEVGIHPLQVESIAFAWLASRHVNRQVGNLPRVTGARGPRILGALYPA